MSTSSAIEAFHGLRIWFLGSKYIYLDVVCPLGFFYLHSPAKVFFHVGFFGQLFGCTSDEEGIGFKGLGNLAYFH